MAPPKDAEPPGQTMGQCGGLLVSVLGVKHQRTLLTLAGRSETTPGHETAIHTPETLKAPRDSLLFLSKLACRICTEQAACWAVFRNKNIVAVCLALS